MKIAILGTKGIPNNYGGYEQFAEYLSMRLVARGHEVTVYNPNFHKFEGSEFNGVKIRRKYSPEHLLGGAANIIYDFLCLRDALRQGFDVIYEAGYHSVALSYLLLGVRGKKRPVILTNMDGLEWRRSKWSRPVQSLIKRLERIAVQESPYLISDNLGIQKYLEEKFSAKSFYISYGADPVIEFKVSFLDNYRLKPQKYFILVARLEPENNVETIIEAHRLSAQEFPLLVVGNHNTPFGNYLKQQFPHDGVRFLGGIYNKAELDSLRHFSIGYFHGHSVGGTNPSLLEAMASQSFIIAHKNPFNESVLGTEALYFSNQQDIVAMLKSIQDESEKNRTAFTLSNLKKIETLYNWELIADQHVDLFVKLMAL